MRRSIFQSGAALLSVAAFGTGTLLASTADAAVIPPAFDAPGITQAGFPDFSNSNDVSLVFLKVPFASDYLLTASGSAGAFNLTSTRSFSVADELFAMYAEFNSEGHFLSGGETIFGSIPDLTSNRFQSLYSVAFDKYAVSTSTTGLGFESVLAPASGFAGQYQHTDESFYLYSSALASLDNALASGKKLPGLFTATVSEFTTVPIPAVGWLLGAGILGLIAIGRPRRPPPEDLNARSGSAKTPGGQTFKARARNKPSEWRWYGPYSSWPGELC
jgi:hypothetical protein